MSALIDDDRVQAAKKAIGGVSIYRGLVVAGLVGICGEGLLTWRQQGVMVEQIVQIKQAQASQGELMKSYAESFISRSEYVEAIKRLESERAAIEQQIQDLRQELLGTYQGPVNPPGWRKSIRERRGRDNFDDTERTRNW